MDFAFYAVAAFAVFIGSFFATVSGFGFALVTTPLLSMVLPLKTCVVFIMALTIILRILTMYRVWGQFDWRTVLTVIAGSTMGIIPGSYLLKVISLSGLQLVMGAVLLVAVVLMELQYTLPVKNLTLGRLVAGFLSGLSGSTTSFSGPPLVLYFLNEKMDKDLMRANMIWIFGMGSVIMMLGSIISGTAREINEWNMFALLAVATVGGVLAGERFFNRLNQHLFRRLCIIFVSFGAVMMVVNGIRNF